MYLSLANIGKVELIEIKASDKIYHAASYFILAFLWFLFFYIKKTKAINLRIKAIAFLLILFGIIIEALQSILTTYRTFDMWDALANAVGISIAYLFFNYFITHIFKK